MDDDDLRSHVARGLQRLTDDILMDRYDDPHVAFTVMLYPDSPPKIVAITPSGSGACDLARIQFGDENDPAPKDAKRFFTREELDDAGSALDKAAMGMRIAQPSSPGTLGFQVMDFVARSWERSRTYAIETTLKKAAHEQARPMVCPCCHQRFTKRGFPQHLRLARWCSQRVEIDAESGEGVLQEGRGEPESPQPGHETVDP